MERYDPGQRGGGFFLNAFLKYMIIPHTLMITFRDYKDSILGMKTGRLVYLLCCFKPRQQRSYRELST